MFQERGSGHGLSGVEYAIELRLAVQESLQQLYLDIENAEVAAHDAALPIDSTAQHAGSSGSGDLPAGGAAAAIGATAATADSIAQNWRISNKDADAAGAVRTPKQRHKATNHSQEHPYVAACHRLSRRH